MTEPELQLPFVSLEYPDAVARAEAEDKLLLIDATAQWCGPCRIMERTTWSNDEVRAWIGEHAVAIKVDVDEQTALAQHFRIQSMPTVVALRGGSELDRIKAEREREMTVIGTGEAPIARQVLR